MYKEEFLKSLLSSENYKPEELVKSSLNYPFSAKGLEGEELHENKDVILESFEELYPNCDVKIEPYVSLSGEFNLDVKIFKRHI